MLEETPEGFNASVRRRFGTEKDVLGAFTRFVFPIGARPPATEGQRQDRGIPLAP
jgi:hypothetical protein